ncbi:MAG: EF-P lysine aminoacylase GenX [Pseudomonadales bacterium]|nr:EF-P lysine aminoacylase GenX [Pseudomonadales bacterium]
MSTSHTSDYHAALQHRAQLYQRIRDFFLQRDVLEVDTPLLGVATVTDAYIESLPAGEGKWLQTSPEYFMKRLLASGSGDIYQICKAFRKEEIGSRHNEEFTLLEWYRLDFDLWDLMDEMADLIEYLLGVHHFEHKSYTAVFEECLGFNPFTITLSQLIFEAKEQIDIEMPDGSRDDWLNLLMSHVIEPQLGQDAPVFIYDYPPSQASLAKLGLDESGLEVASRFELYYQGLELANGYHELTDVAQQKQRFHQDNLQRVKMGLAPMPIDYAFLQALEVGLPDCAGVALGLDRLLMLRLGKDNIEQVLSFR